MKKNRISFYLMAFINSKIHMIYLSILDKNFTTTIKKFYYSNKFYNKGYKFIYFNNFS